MIYLYLLLSWVGCIWLHYMSWICLIWGWVKPPAIKKQPLNISTAKSTSSWSWDFRSQPGVQGPELTNGHISTKQISGHYKYKFYSQKMARDLYATSRTPVICFGLVDCFQWDVNQGTIPWSLPSASGMTSRVVALQEDFQVGSAFWSCGWVEHRCNHPVIHSSHGEPRVNYVSIGG